MDEDYFLTPHRFLRLSSSTSPRIINKPFVFYIQVHVPGKHEDRRGLYPMISRRKGPSCKTCSSDSIKCQTGFGGFSGCDPAVHTPQIARPGPRPRGRRRDHAFAGANSRRAAPLRGRAPAPRAPARLADARATAPAGARASVTLLRGCAGRAFLWTGRGAFVCVTA